MRTALPSTITEYHEHLSSTYIPTTATPEVGEKSETVLSQAPEPSEDPVGFADHVGLDYAERLLLLDAALRRDPIIGLRAWARHLRLNDRTVRRALDHLETLGVLRCTPTGPGRPALIRLVGVLPRPHLEGPEAEIPHPDAEIRHLHVIEAPHPASETPHPTSLGPGSRTLERKEKSELLLHDLLGRLSPAHVQELRSPRNTGGRRALVDALLELGEANADPVGRVLAAPLPVGLRSVTAWLLSQARAALEDPLGTAASPPPTDPVADYARTQAASVFDARDAAVVRRGLELDYAHDPEARSRALAVFDAQVALA